ncbi:MAG TPA: CHAT domain-containing protein [Candidatus Angelobacter sp.]|nr:CHAT domain-containing protein [Candidatus Angelobacter sp.]
MKYLRSNTFLAVLLGATLCAFAQASKYSTDPKTVHPNGVVVEAVTSPEARETGIRAGDILLRWSRREEHGDIQSPFEWFRVTHEQAPKGKVRVEGLRGRKPQSWLIGADHLGIETRPNLAGTWLSIYQEGRRLSKQGASAQSLDRWRAAAAVARADGIRWLECWLISRIAASLASAGRRDEADAEYKAAFDLSDGATRAELLWEQARLLLLRGDELASEVHFARTKEEWEKIDPNGIMVANTLIFMGSAAVKRGDFDKAELNLQQGLSIAKVIAPESLQTRYGLGNLGHISYSRGNLIQAEKYFLAWLAIERKSLSRTAGQSLVLTSLGVIAYERGDLAKAERYYRKALEIVEVLNPGSREASEILNRIGYCRLKQGDLTAAERYQERALAILKKLNSGSFDAADLANIYVGLGDIAECRSNFGLAEAYDRQALAVVEKLIPPPAPEIAKTMIRLGSAVDKRGDLKSAEGYYRQALGMMDKLMPESIFDIDALTGLAGVLVQQGRRDEALAILRDVIGKVENPEHLGGSNEDRSLHRAKYERFYQLYSALMLDRGELQSALSIVERSRARTFAEMLAQSQVNTRQGLSSELLERDRHLQEALNAKWQYRIRLLSGKHTDDQLAVLDQEISRLREQYDELEGEMEAKGPALAQAQPLSASEIQQLLDPETVLIEYSLGEEKSYVFAVTGDSIAAFTLPKRSEIELVARRVYDLVTGHNGRKKDETEQQREARFAQTDISLARASSDLSRMVLNPLASLLPGKKLLIVSDGALQYIPFAALPDPNHPKQLLVASHEIVNLPSASLVAELRQQEANRARPPNEIAVLADPVFDSSDSRLSHSANIFPNTSTARSPSNQPFLRSHPGALRLSLEARPESQMDRLSRSAADLGFARRDADFYLKRLIYTRLEAKSIMAVTPAGKGKQALDFQASRAMAMSPELSQYRIVHFATHGLVDNKHPELSGLVLSLVDRHGRPKDGFLDLQDIYNMKLPVDLVVLSACDTGLGEELSGEGLIGLTRGFMYAGASRVMASLWSVSDKATAELMSRFYKAMEQDGLRPPAALRRAQEEMQRQPRWRSPFYWAGFQLQGEWR